MILPEAAWRRQAGMEALVAALGAADGAVRYVGGVVRDTLLGVPVSDIDLATRLLPGESVRRIAAAGFKAVPTGIAHGTVTAILPHGPVEVTTLRRDVETDGRHARVAFTDDWQEDAARRDFTINALSADPTSGLIHDYFGGRHDLERGQVRFIGDPMQRIAEDHLRILRFFRFHARFGRGGPDAVGLAACVARANDLMALSRERIAQELLKLLAVEDPLPAVAAMIDHAILRPVLPEIGTAGVTRLEALVAAERDADETSAIRRLAALLPRDPALAEAIAARLKLSKAARKRLARAADPAEPGDARILAHAIGIEGARDRLLLAGNGAGLTSLADWQVPRLPLSGGDLLAMGLAPSPRVAATLQAIERRWVGEGFPDAARVRQIASEEVRRAAP